jgi:hypothetical protein
MSSLAARYGGNLYHFTISNYLSLFLAFDIKSSKSSFAVVPFFTTSQLISLVKFFPQDKKNYKIAK